MTGGWRASILLMSLLLVSAYSEPRWRVLNHAARQAIQENNYSKLRATLVELKPLMPGNPRVTYNLAASEAKLGNPEAALTGLRNLAGMGLIYDIAADKDFSSLSPKSEFAAILKRIDENKKPVTHSKPAFVLAERDLIPEDIAHDPKTGRFFISSVRKAKIVTGDGKEFAWNIQAFERFPPDRQTEHGSVDALRYVNLAVAADGHVAQQAFDRRINPLLQCARISVEG